jgi:group I intron endonuclease
VDTYKATNTANGRFYIGSTTNFSRRKTEHLECEENYPFQNALRKNPEAFEWEVWSDDSSEPILEQALLDMWFGKECCYNLNPSSQHPPSWSGKNHKQETRNKQSTSARNRWERMSEKEREQYSLRFAGEKNPATRQDVQDKIGNTNSLRWDNKWEVEGPDGTAYVITNLRRFCREHNLNRSCMMNLVKQQKGQKSHRGFRLRGNQG